MLERPEVYPYQRIEEKQIGTHRKRFRKWEGKIPKSNIRLKTNLKNLDLTQFCTVQNLLFAVAAVILGRAFLLAELLPFAFAFLVAFAYHNREKTILISVFTVIGFLTVLEGFDLWKNIITLLIMVVVLRCWSINEERKWWGMPLLTVSVVLLTKSLLLLLPGQHSFYQQMVIVFEAMIAGVVTFVFLVAGDVTRKNKVISQLNFEEMAAFVVLGTGIVMGINDLYIAGLGISSILCRLGILVSAFLWGAGGATMVGVMAGIIPSISSSIFTENLAIYALSGLLAGAFRHFGKLGVVMGFMLGNLALSMFIGDSQAAIMGMWETIIATLIFFLFPQFLQDKLQSGFSDHSSGREIYNRPVLDHNINEVARNQIHHLAEVFDELSASFIEKSSTAQNHRGAYLSYLYDELSHGFCEGCSRHEHCWKIEAYSTSQEILDIFTMAENQGQVNYEDCPSTFRRKCIHGRELISTINYLFDNLRTSEYWSGKIEESRQLVSRQLKGVSGVVKELAEEFNNQGYVDVELREHILKACKRRGVMVQDVTPVRTSNEQVHFNVVAHSCVDGTGCDLSIAPAISTILGEKLEVCNKQCPRFMGKGTCEFTLTRAFNYRINSAAVQVPREEVCGDSLKITTLKEGKELIVLSDGMGVGEDAANESVTAVSLLENLLNGGFEKELALKTINSVLLLRSLRETFTTLDMILVDLYTGDVDFVKTASAPSFVKRGKQVAVIRSSSLPMGILETLEIVSDQRVLKPGDMLLMVSDGVMEASRDVQGEDWIQALLVDIAERDPQAVAELIMNRALSLCQGTPRDDMTVICLVMEMN
ncbi:MAG: stage II sporulation protein E [Bacillota bacterium]|nr:stage II sporulation protein E [Bacillota bacterium]